MKKYSLLFVVVLLLVTKPTYVKAEYLRTGEAVALGSAFFGIAVTRFVIHTFPRVLSDVSDYSPGKAGKGRCWIRARRINVPLYQQDKSGELVPLTKFDYVTFPCVQR